MSVMMSLRDLLPREPREKVRYAAGALPGKCLHVLVVWRKVGGDELRPWTLRYERVALRCVRDHDAVRVWINERLQHATHGDASVWY